MSQDNPSTPGQPSPAVATPQTVTIPLEQLQAFTSIQARLAEHEERVRRESQEAQRREAEVLAERGNLQDALRQLREQSEQQLIVERQKHAEVQQRAQQYALDSELSRALAGENLVPGGVEQLSRLFRGEFVVEPQGQAFQVRTPAFQSVPDFIKRSSAGPNSPTSSAPRTPAEARRPASPCRPHRRPPPIPRSASSPGTWARRSSCTCRVSRRPRVIPGPT